MAAATVASEAILTSSGDFVSISTSATIQDPTVAGISAPTAAQSTSNIPMGSGGDVSDSSELVEGAVAVPLHQEHSPEAMSDMTSHLRGDAIATDSTDMPVSPAVVLLGHLQEQMDRDLASIRAAAQQAAEEAAAAEAVSSCLSL